MKKIIFAAATAVLSASIIFTACASKDNAESEKSPEEVGEVVTLNIGATARPHAEILNEIKDDLKAEGVNLIVTEFGDYTLLNPSLNDKQIDGNFFQHTPYLDDYVKNSGQDLVEVVKVHIEPMGVYSKKITNINEIADGAVVCIPNDSTNEARALLLLESQGLIQLNSEAGINATPKDIVSNPKNLNFNELDASVLPRVLDESDVAVINTNYALEAGLNPVNDSLAIEGEDSPYANVLVVRGEDKDSQAVQKLVDVLTSDKVRDLINEKYEGAIVPVF